MSSGDVSHRWTSAFHNHFDYNLIVFKHIQLRFLARGLNIWRKGINVFNNIDWIVRFVFTIHRLPRSEIWETFPRTETMRSHNSRAGKPSNFSPVSNEKISDSVELWETAVCFLHIQLIGTNVWLPKMHTLPPEVDFESSRSPAMSESWNSPSLHCLAIFPKWQYYLYSHVWWIYENNRFRRLSQALLHFVMDRASLFTDHRISSRQIIAKYRLLRTIWDHTCDNSPTDFVSSSLKWWTSMHGIDTL